jgi:hypothetical protein
MPLISGSLSDDQPLIPVLIFPILDTSTGISGHQFTALIDTGATKTCFTRTAVEILKLQPFTRLLVATPNGLERRKGYSFTVGFVDEGDGGVSSIRSTYVFPRPVIGADFVKNSNFDVLIGMDILGTGRLLFEGGRFEFSFAG